MNLRHAVTAAAALAATAALLAGAPATARPTMPPTGGDSRPCATYREFLLLNLGQTRTEVRRILDTAGRKVSGKTYDAVFGGVPGLDVSGLPASPRRHDRSYPTCAEDGVPALLMVEYDSPHGTSQSFLWQ